MTTDDAQADELRGRQTRESVQEEIQQELRRELIAAAGDDRILSTNELATYLLSPEALNGASIGITVNANGSAVHMVGAMQSGRSLFGYGPYNDRQMQRSAEEQASDVISQVRDVLVNSGVRIQTDRSSLSVRLGQILDVRERGASNLVGQ